MSKKRSFGTLDRKAQARVLFDELIGTGCWDELCARNSVTAGKVLVAAEWIDGETMMRPKRGISDKKLRAIEVWWRAAGKMCR